MPNPLNMQAEERRTFETKGVGRAEEAFSRCSSPNSSGTQAGDSGGSIHLHHAGRFNSWQGWNYISRQVDGDDRKGHLAFLST